MNVRVSVTALDAHRDPRRVRSTDRRRPVGSVNGTSTVTSRVAPDTTTGRRVGADERGELVEVALDGHDQRVDLTDGDPEAGGRRAGHDRVHGHGPVLEVLEHRHLEVDQGGLDVDAGRRSRRSRRRRRAATSRSTFDARWRRSWRVTRAVTTRSTSGDGPVTSTVVGRDRDLADLEAVGRRPTGLGDDLDRLVIFVVERDEIDGGPDSTTVIRGSTRRDVDPDASPGCRRARTLTGRRSRGSRRGRGPADVGRGEVLDCSMSRSWLVTTVSAGWLTGVTCDRDPGRCCCPATRRSPRTGGSRGRSPPA